MIAAVRTVLLGAVEIVSGRSEEGVQAYLRSLEGDQRTLNEVKVLFVGDGSAGKTSLLKCLIGRAFDDDEAKTDGINIEQGLLRYADQEVRLNLWDFGGQEIMHATHQFFLSKRSLYVLVLDGRKEEDAEYLVAARPHVWGKLTRSGSPQQDRPKSCLRSQPQVSSGQIPKH